MRKGVLYLERPTIMMAMARVRDAVGVLNGLGKVAAAYSAAVTTEMEEIVGNVSNFLISRSGGKEGAGRGLPPPDDFPEWEFNFTAGEFGVGAEYNSPIATPPNAYHPKATHDATDGQTHEHSIHPHHPTPPTDLLSRANGGERSFHSVANRGLSLSQVKAFHQLKSSKAWLSTSVCHYTTSGDTVVGPSATDDKMQGSHVEQQKKVRS